MNKFTERINAGEILVADGATGSNLQKMGLKPGRPPEDLVIDDATWMLPQLVIDTRNWLPGRKVVIDTSRLRSVDWANRHIVVDMSRRDVESSPETDRSPITARG